MESEVPTKQVLEISENDEIGEVISDGETPSFRKFRFKAYSDKFISPASIVAIKIDDDNFLIGRNTASHEINPNYSPEKVAVRHSMNIPSEHPEEGMSINVFRVYEAELINQVSKKDNQYLVFSPESLPKAGSKVIIPSEEMISEVLGIQNKKEDGLFLGNLATTISSENKIPVVLKKEVVQRHIFIGGTTGGGKSYAARVLAEEIHKHKLPVIFFDTQEEFTSLVRNLNGQVLRPGQDYAIRLSSLTEDEVLELVPSVHHKLHLEILSAAFIKARENGVEFGTDDLIREIHQVCVEQSAEKSETMIVNRVKSYLKSYDFIGGESNWSTMLRNSNMINIDCHGISRHKLQLILAATMRELQRLRSSNSIPPYVLFIDEAHLFVPDGEQSACKQIIRENVRMGRHNGICLVLITQSPIDIDKKVIRQCNTRLLFSLEPDQLSALQGVRSDATTDMIDRLPKSPVGTCLVSGTYETVKHALPLAIREIETPDSDSGRAPPIFDEVKNLYE